MLGTGKKTIIGSISFLFFFLTSIFVGANYETNDDAAIAFLISKGKDAGAIFQEKWLVCFLIRLFKIVPSVNRWTAFSVFVISVSLAVICILIAGRIGEKYQCYLVMAGVTYIVFEVFVAHMNFTKTAAMPIIAANALVADSIGKDRLTFSPSYLLVIVLYLVGLAIREEVALLGLAFLGLLLCWQLFYSYRCEKRCFDIKKQLIKAGFCLSIVLVVLLMSRVNRSLRTEAENEYVTYNTHRAMVQDYSDSYPDPEEYPVVYESDGYRTNDVKAIFSWIDNDTENITADTFKELAVYKQKRTFSGLFCSAVDVLKLIVSDYFVFFPLAAVFGICVVFCISEPITNGIKALVFFGAFFVMTVYFQWTGRLPGRVLESCAFLLAGALLFSSFQFDYEKYLCNRKKIKRSYLISAVAVFHVLFLIISPWLGRLKQVAFASLALLLFGFVYFVSEEHREFVETITERFRKYAKVIGLAGFVAVFLFVLTIRGNKVVSIFEKSGEKPVLEYINQNDDKVFIVPVLSLDTSVQESKNIWEMADNDYCSNLFYLGGWDSRSPAYNRMKLAQGIDNPMRALVDDERVYSVEKNTRISQIVLTYLRDHFDDSTTYTRTSDAFDRWFIRYQKAIKPELEESVYRLELNKIMFSEDGFMSIYAKTDYSGELLYCNIITDGEEKTYAITSENGTIENQLAELEGIRENGIETMVFFAKENGKYVLLGKYSKEQLQQLH